MKKALIIEGNEDNMKLITFFLEKNGYSTVWADRGRKGVKLTLDENPDFVILDIQLPDIDGSEVLKEIRKSEVNSEIPVIAMTSHAMSGDRENLLATGYNGCIEKPIDPFTVMKQIQAVLGE